MKYLLDTNICIYIINEKPEKVLRKFEQYPNKNTNQDALDEFLLPLTILPFHGKKLVTCYGEIRASLESKGKTIGPLDMLIAAHALSLDLTIISNNIKEFSRIPNLKCENWIREL
jgi:tRNA(fMet)-specific endonuclease VapC